MGKVFQTLGQKPVIAVVGVASLKDNRLIYGLMSLLLKANCKCKVYRVSLAYPRADIEKAKGILRKADGVFMSGGDAEVGMQILKGKKMEDFLRELAAQGKLFVGMSAGTIMLCQEWVRWQDPDDDATCQLYPCLGLADAICDTHAEGDDWVELKAALKIEKEGAMGYGIPSGGYLKAYPDGRIEACVEPSGRFVKTNGKVERQPDLMPGK
jgi:hypothetical protein